MANTFTKISKWAEQVGAEVRDAKYGNHIYVELPSGQKFEFEQRESSMYRSCRGGKMKGNPKGLYMMEVPSKGYGGYFFNEPSQAKCIEEMKKFL
jgi:hypothetical protein